MRKIYSLVLIAAALLVGTNAWAETRTAGTFQQLQDALSDANPGDVIELTADISYPTNGTGIVDINKSITLDGKGHILWGYGTANIAASGDAKNFFTVLAVNAGQFGSTSELDVKILNLTFGDIKNEFFENGMYKALANTKDRFYGLVVYDGVKNLKLDNVQIIRGLGSYNPSATDPNKVLVFSSGWYQMLCITGTESAPLNLTIDNSYVYAGLNRYPVYILKPINANLTNSKFEGYCSLYFKYRATGVYGNVIGTRGSVVNAESCTFNAPNVHSGLSNAFAIFPFEDDGITMNLNNCSFNADHFGNQYQALVSVQYNSRTSGWQSVVVNLTGDNTHLYNVDADNYVWNGMAKGESAQVDINSDGIKDANDAVNVPITLNINGGTYSINPQTVTYYVYGGGTATATIPVGYEVQEVSQGGVTLYRVVKSVPRDGSGDPLYDLNDAVETVGEEGENPATSFELSSGVTMELDEDREVTTAGYVQVKDNESTSAATTVKVGTTSTSDPTQKVDQTLIVNNGLDVQGNSKVEVQAGSSLVIGEGGITTASPANIVLGADEDGGASLLLHPDITVNQTPELTVMMKAEQVGIYETEFYWHRFAMPVASISALPHTPNTPTAIYGWDYNAQDWYALSSLNQLVPFAGYALTVNGDRQDVTYTFQGNLTGNINTDLAFSHQGYNFFGNSYTGYIKVSYLANEIIGNADIDASIWMWNPATQSYAAVGLQALKEAEDGGYAAAMYRNWQREIAPMQTFILRLPNTTSATAEVDYAATIWANPRYAGSATPAPARANAEIEGTIVRLSVADANGNSDEMLFMEKDSYSDAYDRGYDATKYMNSNNMNMYTLQNGEKLSAVATDNLNGKSFDIETKCAISYTLTFDAVLGETNYAVRDNVTGATIAMNQGSTYTFTAQPNSTVAGRFTFVPVQNMPTDVETVEANSNVRGIYTITGQYVGEDFESLPAGVYVVDGVKIVK